MLFTCFSESHFSFNRRCHKSTSSSKKSCHIYCYLPFNERVEIVTQFIPGTIHNWFHFSESPKWARFTKFFLHSNCTSPNSLNVKDTWYLWGKNSENMQLLDVLVCNTANKPSFQNLTKSHFVRFWKGGLLAELQARMQIFAIFGS